MNYAQAIYKLMEGMYVRRRVWPPNTWVCWVQEQTVSRDSVLFGDYKPRRDVRVRQHLGKFSDHDGTYDVGWVPPNADIAATDWETWEFPSEAS